MRIVAGKYGGRKLHVPQNNDIRPTSDKVRGAIFNALLSRIDLEGAVVLDAFCGTGALGLEALSRGAGRCIFIDKNKKSLDLAKQNAQDLGAENAAFLLKDSSKIEARRDDLLQANLLFLDPPYGQDLIIKTLEALEEGQWIFPDAVIVIESEKDFSGSFPLNFNLIDERLYGDTKIIYAAYRQGSRGT